MATKLDQFKQEKKQLEYELNGKKYIAKLNALVLLDAMAIINRNQGNDSEQMKALISAVFGKKAAEELFIELNLEGINIITKEIIEGLGLKVSGK